MTLGFCGHCGFIETEKADSLVGLGSPINFYGTLRARSKGANDRGLVDSKSLFLLESSEWKKAIQNLDKTYLLKNGIYTIFEQIRP
jgi:hypothetical protein